MMKPIKQCPCVRYREQVHKADTETEKAGTHTHTQKKKTGTQSSYRTVLKGTER